MKKNRRFESGFGQIELLMSVAILATVALAAAGVANMFSHASDYGDKKNEQLALSSLLLNAVARPNNCSDSIGPTSGYNNPVDVTALKASSANGGGWEIKMNLPTIKSNADMAGTMIQAGSLLPLRRLSVRTLRLADGVNLTPGPPPRTYIASLIVGTNELGGRTQKETIAASLLLTIDSTNAISSCQTMSSTDYKQTCSDMGCKFDVPTNSCSCLKTQVVCAAPGYVPVAFDSAGMPDCRPVGGGLQCPAGQFLVAVGIDWYKCGPLPTSTPPPAGPPLPTTCPAQTLSWTVAGNTCSGPAASTANGATTNVSSSSGSATFACNTGAWAGTPNAGATCSGAPPNMCPDGVTVKHQFWSPISTCSMGSSGGPCPSTCTYAPGISSSADACIDQAVGTQCTDATTRYSCQSTCPAAPSPCPAQTLSWTVAGNTCSGPAGSTASGSTATVSSGSDSATFACNASAWAATPNAGATCSAFSPPACSLCSVIDAAQPAAFMSANCTGAVVGPLGCDYGSSFKGNCGPSACTAVCTVRFPTMWDDGANGPWFCDARGSGSVSLVDGQDYTYSNDNGGHDKSSGLSCVQGMGNCDGSMTVHCSASTGLSIVSQSCTAP